MAHSKRNTSRSVFTSHERDIAKAAWSSTSARLTRDSFLPFGSCYLCLEIARDPVSCSHGDIFCRECAVANLLAQKKEIKRLDRAREKAEQEYLEAQARQDAEAQERTVTEFEMIQAGIVPSLLSASSMSASRSTTTDADTIADESTAKQGTKRKFVLDQVELERIANEDRIKAKKSIQDEKISKKSLPSFWTPSQTPDADAARKATDKLKKLKLTPVCPASPEELQHPYSLKSLIRLNFKEETDPQTKGTRRVCPSCLKILGNASRPQLAEKCGHIICRSCAAKFMLLEKDNHALQQENACYVCDARLASKDINEKQKKSKGEFVGLIELRSDGTGFSARGANKVEKSGVAAFQC
ncbi:ring finger domain-containing protein [Colletotrichum truncatum]|uniref:Ring finger domain-containing protein n=1 Tax=Colletotrichum truncatum TaxID=5467 RepID=A0ACC3YFU3_COLTU|nr:ring finger domain-containing protein [Colletotrichum truncatum]KAF6784556.1 ring finger domain-containing protein [Colletotrichum truncatum]